VRYPWVREFGTWNEANLASAQPTGHHPRRTAAYYRALKRRCKGCTVVARRPAPDRQLADLAVDPRLRARAGTRRLIFGLHNYPEVTRLRSQVTREFIRRFPRARVWITETGGIVRHNRWEYNEDRAARVIRHVFRVTNRLRRIERLYLYNWRFDGNRDWDSGLIAADGRERLRLLRAARRPVAGALQADRAAGERADRTAAGRLAAAALLAVGGELLLALFLAVLAFGRWTSPPLSRTSLPERAPLRSSTSAAPPRTTCIEGREPFHQRGRAPRTARRTYRHSNS
jgi:hypothetical protein